MPTNTLPTIEIGDYNGKALRSRDEMSFGDLPTIDKFVGKELADRDTWQKTTSDAFKQQKLSPYWVQKRATDEFERLYAKYGTVHADEDIENIRKSGVESWTGIDDAWFRSDYTKNNGNTEKFADRTADDEKTLMDRDRLNNMAVAHNLVRYPQNFIPYLKTLNKERREEIYALAFQLANKNPERYQDGILADLATSFSRGASESAHSLVKAAETVPQQFFDLFGAEAPEVIRNFQEQSQLKYDVSREAMQVSDSIMPAKAEELGLLGEATTTAMRAAPAMIEGMATAEATAGYGTVPFWYAEIQPGIEQKFKDMGMSRRKASLVSIPSAALLGAMEKYAQDEWFGVKATVPLVGKKSIMLSLDNYVRGVTAETVQEASQSLAEYLIGATMAEMDPSLKFDHTKEWAAMKEEIRQAAISMPFLVGAGSIAQVGKNYSLGQELIRQEQSYELTKAVAATKYANGDENKAQLIWDILSGKGTKEDVEDLFGEKLDAREVPEKVRELRDSVVSGLEEYATTTYGGEIVNAYKSIEKAVGGLKMMQEGEVWAQDNPDVAATLREKDYLSRRDVKNLGLDKMSKDERDFFLEGVKGAEADVLYEQSAQERYSTAEKMKEEGQSIPEELQEDFPEFAQETQETTKEPDNKLQDIEIQEPEKSVDLSKRTIVQEGGIEEEPAVEQDSELSKAEKELEDFDQTLRTKSGEYRKKISKANKENLKQLEDRVATIKAAKSEKLPDRKQTVELPPLAKPAEIKKAEETPDSGMTESYRDFVAVLGQTNKFLNDAKISVGHKITVEDAARLQGITLETLAEQYGMPVDDIREASVNGLNLVDEVQGVVIRLAKGASPQTLLHELAEAYFKGQSRTWQIDTEEELREHYRINNLQWQNIREAYADTAAALFLSDLDTKQGEKETPSGKPLSIMRLFEGFRDFFTNYVLPAIDAVRTSLVSGVIGETTEGKLRAPFREDKKAQKKQKPPVEKPKAEAKPDTNETAFIKRAKRNGWKPEETVAALTMIRANAEYLDISVDDWIEIYGQDENLLKKQASEISSIFEKGDFSGLVYRLGRIFRSTLQDQEQRVANEHVGAEYGKDWTEKQEKKFAGDFVLFASKGIAPKGSSKDIRAIFKSMKDWLVSLFKSLEMFNRTILRGKNKGKTEYKKPTVSPQIESVFKRMLAGDNTLLSNKEKKIREAKVSEQDYEKAVSKAQAMVSEELNVVSKGAIPEDVRNEVGRDIAEKYVELVRQRNSTIAIFNETRKVLHGGSGELKKELAKGADAPEIEDYFKQSEDNAEQLEALKEIIGIPGIEDREAAGIAVEMGYQEKVKLFDEDGEPNADLYNAAWDWVFQGDDAYEWAANYQAAEETTEEILGDDDIAFQIIPKKPVPVTPPPKPSDVTSIANAAVDLRRAQAGLPELSSQEEVAFEDLLRFGQNVLADDPDHGKRLISEFRLRPRVWDATESTVVSIYYRSLHNKANDLASKVSSEKDDHERDLLNNALSEAMLEINAIEPVLRHAGSEAGRALIARRIALASDYSLDAMIAKVVADKGRGLTEKERKEIEGLHKTIADQRRELEELRDRQSTENYILEVRKNVPDAKRRKEGAKSAKSALAAMYKKGKPTAQITSKISFEIEGPSREDLAKAVVSGYLESGVTSFQQLINKARKEVGDAIDDDIDLFRAAWDAESVAYEVFDEANPPEELEDIYDLANESLKMHIHEGTHSLKALTRLVHEDLVQMMGPGWSRHDTQKAITRYEDVKKLNKDMDKRIEREIRSLTRNLVHRERMRRGEELLKTREVPEVTDSQRRARARLYELKKKHGYLQVNRERQLASSQKSRVTALNNLIKDLKDAIANERRIVRERGKLEDTPEITAKKKELAQLRAVYKEMFPPRQTTEESRVIAKEKRLEKHIERLKKELEAGKRAEKAAEVTSERIKELESELERVRKEHKEKLPKPEPTEADRISAKEKRIERNIAKMRKELESGERAAKAVEVTSEKIRQLQAEQAEVRKKHSARFPKSTLTEEQKVQREMKALDRAIKIMEKSLKAGDIMPKKREQRQDARLEERRARLTELRAQREAMREKSPEWRQREDMLALAHLQGRLADIKRRVAEEDFEPKPKKERVRTREELRLMYEIDQEKQRFELLRQKATLSSRTRLEKALHYGGEVMNLSRAIWTSFDISGILRQGGLAIGHPVLVAKAAAKSMKALLSKDSHFEIQQEIRDRENAPLYATSNLAITTGELKLAKQEEAYMGELGKYVPGVAASERAYVSYLSLIRADLFDAFASQLGKGGQVTLGEAKAISNFINVMTGRGSLGEGVKGLEFMSRASVLMATVFFSPRYVASRFQFLAGQPIWNSNNTKATRDLVTKEYAKIIGAYALFYSLIAAASKIFWDDDDEDKPTIGTDITSSDFGKIVIGDTRTDFLAGLSQSMVLLGRMGTGVQTTASGKKLDLNDPVNPVMDPTRGTVAFRFLRSKLAPVPGTAVDWLFGKDYMGEEVNKADVLPLVKAVREKTLEPEALLGQAATPLAVQEVYESMKANGVPGGLALSTLVMLGIGVQNYGNDMPGTKEEYQKEVKKLQKKIGTTVGFTDKEREMEAKNPGSGVERYKKRLQGARKDAEYAAKKLEKLRNMDYQSLP